MAAVGLVPSEYSSGGKRKQGSIIKVGNGHVRRILRGMHKSGCASGIIDRGQTRVGKNRPL